MSSHVRALETTHVHPAETGDPSPPCHSEHKLSFLDLLQITKKPIEWLLFFYNEPDLSAFPTMVASLQASLATTFAAFHPASGDVVMDCSHASVSSGVKFVEAEFSSCADERRRIAMADEHDTEAFAQLVPEIEAAKLPAPLIVVQFSMLR